MSIWGTGNFERDDSLNVLDRWIEQIRQQIRETFQLERENSLYKDFGESRIIANIDILTTLLNRYRTYPYIELDEIKQWREEYLKTFDQTVHVYDPKPEFEKERRREIEQTFDRFHEVVRQILED